MAIRPTDLQGAIFQATQTAPITQRAEEAPRLAQAAAQAAFVNETEVREERVAGTSEALGNKIDPNAHHRQDAEYDPQERRHAGAFEEVVDEAAGLDEPAHLIDFTA
ncbi:MAG TPA: hypothetical protein VMD91_00535 [Candidatus Sulfotelmatobacter sp.]|nr:hypothetical protein [Candidatus Sulfotelmatobacter sp.]